MKKIRLITCLSVALCTGVTTQADTPLFNAEGYRVPTPQPSFTFPSAHGSHPDFRIEWWYLTGFVHNQDAPDEMFGIQATFFRYALQPPASRSDNISPHFGDHHVFMAHMALAEPDAQRFTHEERLNRNGWDAHAREGDLDLRNGNWSLKRTHDHTMSLHGSVLGHASFALKLTPSKPLVRFGQQGFSRKGSAPDAASWYLTWPRLTTSGTLTIAGREITVQGELWMDHEISSSQLDNNQVGWDWTSLRLNDGREVMLYILRHEDGSIDPHSTLAWIDKEGNVTHSGPTDFSWQPRRHWTSPKTGTRYPVAFTLSTTDPASGAPLTLLIDPLLDAQEMIGHLGGVNYWEAACRVTSTNGSPLGLAYVELTGYDGSLAERLR